MILDHNFHKKRGQLTFSYIAENGAKRLLVYNISRFKTFYTNPLGKYTNWNGEKCDLTYTENPGWSEIKTFIEELSPEDKALLFAKNTPKLYTFDIETKYDPDVFPDPAIAEFEITNISIVNENCDVIVLGVDGITDESKILKMYWDWLETCEFFKGLGLPMPSFKYKKFDSEHDILKFFLREMVSKIPVLAGWNSLGFDWYYIQNRIKNYYPDLSIAMASIDWSTSVKQIQDMKQNKIRLQIPNHTLILDMMDVVGTFDKVVMPIKENLSLDYIASESPVGMHKISYDGDLEYLRRTDYDKYVFYNAIDSVLVMLIAKCFKTLDNIYTQALYCRTRISNAFSKIALSESLFFNYFYENDIKVVPQGKFEGERGNLQGAYVKPPTPGKHRWMACCDFAGLYPSTIITCNLSIENYMGKVGEQFTPEEVERFKVDSNYFVSVNGCVYRNDKDYAFKKIQMKLKSNRNIYKYLGKQLDALVMLDVEHIEKGLQPSKNPYPDNIVQTLQELGYSFTCGTDLLACVDLEEFKKVLKKEITFCSSFEQAMKLLMNSMYGGSSHQAFEWFNINLANDITAEARWVIHLMEDHIPKFFQDNWVNMTELHKRVGIKLKMSR